MEKNANLNGKKLKIFVSKIITLNSCIISQQMGNGHCQAMTNAQHVM